MEEQSQVIENIYFHLRGLLEVVYRVVTIAISCTFLTFNLWKDNWVTVIAVIYFLPLKWFYCSDNSIELADRNAV